MTMIRKRLLLGGALLLLPAAALAQAPDDAGRDAEPGRDRACDRRAVRRRRPRVTAAPATSTAAIAPGGKVLDTAGGIAGTVESVDGDFVVLATGKSKVRLPKTSFAMGPNGPVIALTAAQLDAAAAQAAPPPTAAATAAKANVTQGAAVSDTQGGAVGTVTSVDGQIATVALTGGSKVRLPVSAFAADSAGGLKVAMTAAQLSAAAGAAK